MSKRIFNFTELPPSLNSVIGKRWALSNAKKRWMILLKESLGPYYHCPEPCTIEIHWRVMHHMDDDNSTARFKTLGDALKRAGYISDDKPSVLRLAKPQQTVVKHLNEQGFTMTISGDAAPTRTDTKWVTREQWEQSK